MKVEHFGFYSRVRARIENGDDVFVSFAGRWEWYRLNSRGYPKGLERFVCFVDDPKHVAVLDRAFRLPAVHPAYPRRVDPNWEKELIPKGERCFRLVLETGYVSTKPGRSDFEGRRRSL